MSFSGKSASGIVGEFGSGRHVVVDHRVRVLAVQLGERVIAGRNREVSTE